MLNDGKVERDGFLEKVYASSEIGKETWLPQY